MGWDGPGEAKNEARKPGLAASWPTKVGWEGLGKAQNGSQEYCGNCLRRPKMKHETGVACFMVPKSGVGRVRPKMKHEKGFGCFMAPKSGVGMVPKSVVGSWFPRVGWEGWV